MRQNASRTAYDFGRQTAPKAETRACDWPDCTGEGEHRAPKARDRLNEYYWFCLDHVRRYNASWNYYAGMTEEEVEADRRRDTVWDRPSWRLGDLRFRHRQPTLDDLHDPFGMFDDEREESDRVHRARSRRTCPEDEALAILDLNPPVDAAKVKARYKELVKRHHPDLNGGDKRAEERFKKINQAYRTVMDSLTP